MATSARILRRAMAESIYIKEWITVQYIFRQQSRSGDRQLRIIIRVRGIDRRDCGNTFKKMADTVVTTPRLHSMKWTYHVYTQCYRGWPVRNYTLPRDLSNSELKCIDGIANTMRGASRGTLTSCTEGLWEEIWSFSHFLKLVPSQIYN